MGTIADSVATADSVGAPSPWILPSDSGFCREPDRPERYRPSDFEAKFDAQTIFYDCFRLRDAQAMLIGPPLLKFKGVLDSLTIRSLPSGSECRFTVRHQFRQCRIIADVRQSDSSLYLHCAAGEAIMAVRPDDCETFRGRRVIFTLSKDNHPQWVCDWMRFYRDVHGADGVLLYDNGSTSQPVEPLLGAMRRVRGFKSVCVVSWPYKYGPQGFDGWHWDSNFCQDGALEDARWRYLATADAVLNTDIDELVVSDHRDVFEAALRSNRAYVRFQGRWAVPWREAPLPYICQGSPDGDVPRHKESMHQLRPHWRWGKFRFQDKNLCPAKWAVVPGRCPVSAQWSVHSILGMRGQTLSPKDLAYRHFREITTNWKYRRSDVGPGERQGAREDELLEEAFARVEWNA